MISQYILDHIDDIIQRMYLDFTYLLTGEDFLTTEEKKKVESFGLLLNRRPLIELLYLMAKYRTSKQYLEHTTLKELLEAIAKRGVVPLLNRYQQETLDDLKQTAFETIKANKNETVRKVKQEIINYNQQVRTNEMLKKPIEPTKVVEKKNKKAVAALGLGLGLILANSKKNFVRDITSTITNTINYGKVGEIMATLDDRATEVLVYKTVINDGHLCEWCHKFYIDSTTGKPKLYKLSDLQANGSNYGKPKSQWKPTVEQTHPRCRCELHYIDPKDKTKI